MQHEAGCAGGRPLIANFQLPIANGQLAIGNPCVEVAELAAGQGDGFLQGEVEAGVTTANLVPQLSDDTKHRLRILAESREIPGLMFMLLPTALSRHPRMQDLLLQFERTETGRKFIDVLAMDGLRIPEKREMKSMDNFLPEIRKHFKH